MPIAKLGFTIFGNYKYKTEQQSDASFKKLESYYIYGMSITLTSRKLNNQLKD